MELFGTLLGLSILAQISVAVIAGLLFPAFWVWMLVDAITRQPEAFPSKDSTEKIVWIILMIALQPIALVYFFLVWRAGRQFVAATLVPVQPLANGAPAGAV